MALGAHPSPFDKDALAFGRSEELGESPSFRAHVPALRQGNAGVAIDAQFGLDLDDVCKRPVGDLPDHPDQTVVQWAILGSRLAGLCAVFGDLRDVGAKGLYVRDAAEPADDILSQALVACAVDDEDAVAGPEQGLHAADMLRVARPNQGSRRRADKAVAQLRDRCRAVPR